MSSVSVSLTVKMAVVVSVLKERLRWYRVWLLVADGLRLWGIDEGDASRVKVVAAQAEVCA